jgi:hypothetical protein
MCVICSRTLESDSYILEIDNCPNVTFIDLTGYTTGYASLERIWISNCKNLRILTGLKNCRKLQTIEIINCQKLSYISDLDSCNELKLLFLEKINLDIFPKLNSPFLKYINIFDGKLKELTDFSTCPNIEKLTCYCEYLRYLPELKNCKALEHLTIFSREITYLPDLSFCEKLKELDCSYCTKLMYIPDLSNCPVNNLKVSSSGIYYLPKFGKKLDKLYCENCFNLKEIHFPLGITLVFCWDCRSLTKLEEIGFWSDISGCPWIEFNNEDFFDNIKKLKILQRSCRKYLFRNKMKRARVMLGL